MSCRHYVFSTHTCLVTTLGLFTGTDWQWRRGTWKLPRDRSILAKSEMPDVGQDWKWTRFLYLSTLLHRYSHRPLLIEIQGVRNSLSRTWTWTGTSSSSVSELLLFFFKSPWLERWCTPAVARGSTFEPGQWSFIYMVTHLGILVALLVIFYCFP